VGYQYRGPEGDDPEELSQELKEAFLKGRERDLKFKSTGSGPHTDDLIFTLQKRPIKNVGSQGEQRNRTEEQKHSGSHARQARGTTEPVELPRGLLQRSPFYR
jgi:recombinational DNA repair ATPase RecF